MIIKKEGSVKLEKRLVALMFGLSLAAPLAANADVNDALLQKLVEKGTLTQAEAEDIQSKNPLNGLKIGGLVYFDYSFGEKGDKTTTPYNTMNLTRAYININKEITPWFKARVTTDVFNTSAAATVTSGTAEEKVTTADSGYAVRIKYTYADFLTPDIGPLTDTFVRAGIIQTPWFDFEETVNIYRMQSTMFQDKQKLSTSSDAGISIGGNIGGRLSKDQIASVGSKSFAGRYGSYYVGAYNGGGYSSTGDTNQNKAVQGRLSIRPVPDVLPGLQLTYFGISGEGNNSTGTPKQWINNTGFLSYQHKYVTATAEYYCGQGNMKGDDDKKNGHSLFGRVVLPMYDKVAFFGRYDILDPDKDGSADKKIETTIGGASYKIQGDNYLVAAYEKTHDHLSSTGANDDVKGQVVLQIAF